MIGILNRRVVLCACIVLACIAGCKPAGSSKSYEDYPEFQEGGTISLTVDGTPRTVNLSDIIFANTDPGYSDYVEVNGNGTRLLFECKKEFNLDFDGEEIYSPIVGFPLPISNLGNEEEEFTIAIPQVDTFVVLEGSLTIEKYTIGRDGHDWWDGKITLTLDAADGPLTVYGTFAWCIVPVW